MKEHLHGSRHVDALRRAPDLEAARAEVEEQPPDVVVLDGAGLDASSPKATRQIAQAYPGLPIVVLTGPDEDGREREQVLEAGATECLRREECTPALLGRALRWAHRQNATERALEKRERELRSITENVTQGIYRSAPGEGLIYVNKAFADMFGYESPEAIQAVDPAQLYVRPERRAELRDRLRREGRFQNEEVQCRRKDGSTFTVLQSGSVVRDEAGEIVFYEGTVTDITERRRAERELEESEKRVRSVLDAVAANVAVIDRTGEIIDVNERWTRFAQENDGDMDAVGVGANYLKACAPAEAEGSSVIPAVREEIRTVVEGEEELFEYQYPCHGPDEERWFLLRATPLERDEGGAVVAHIDVTERVKAVRKQRVLSAAVEQSQEAVLITEAEAVDEPGPEIVYVNSAVEGITGYAEEELLGQTPRLLQGPETEREVLDSLREALEEGDPWQGETVNYRKDGTPYRVQWNVSPVRDEDGDIEYWVSVQRDVTEEREREETLRRQRNLLDQSQKLAGAWEADLQTGKMSWSKEVYRIHEVPPGTQITTDEGIEFYAPEARPKIRDAFQRCIEEGEPYDLELPLITAEGNRRWVRTVGAPSDRKNGEVVKVAGAFQDITDRKEAERELVESEERYRTLAEHFPNGAVGVYDHDLRYSLAEGELLGTRLPTSDELEGDRMPDIFPESTASDLEPMFRAAVEEGVSGRRETTFGGRIWRVWATPLRGPEGEIFAGLSYAQDITEHKQREQALREQRNLLNQTQRLAGGWQVDLESGKISWSEEVYRIHELPLETEIGLDEAIAFFEAGAADELEEALDRCIEDGEHYDLELPLTTAKGNRRWVRTVGAPSERKNGEVVKVAGALQDITERKEAERALREREAQLRGLANSIPGVVFQAYARPGREYGFHIVSEGAEELLGISAHPGDFFERCLERVPDSERESLLEKIDSAVDAEAQLQFESPFVKPSGETIWILGTATPERREDELVYNGVILDITERKNAERALREREEYLSVTLQSIGDAVVATDRDGCVTEMNSVAEQLTGWCQEEAEGELLDDILTLHSARTGESVESPADEVLRDGRTVGLANHTVLTARDGTEYQIADSAAPIQADDGDLRGVVLVFRDITEKYERRRRMERQNDLFAKAQDLANVGGWEYDVRSGEATWTEEVYRIHGLPPDVDASPEQSLQFYHEEDRPVIEEAFAQAVENGESYDLERRLITAEGDERWVRTRGEPQIQDGDVVRVRGTIQDITERKERERRLDAVFNHTYQFTGLMEPDGTFIEANDTALAFGGLTEEDILGTPIWEAYWFQMGQETKQRLRESVQRAADGEFIRYEVEVQGAEDTRIIDFSIRPVRNEDGEVVLLIPEGRDITERKSREKELERATGLLRHAGEMADLGGWSVDVSGERPYSAEWTDTLYDLFELPRDIEPPTEDVFEYYHPDDRERHRRAVMRAAEEGADWDQELRLITAEGRERWVRNIGRAITEDGETVEIRGTIQDITERKRRQTRLEEMHDRMELALDYTSSVVFEIDLETDRVSRIGAYEEFFGKAPEEVSTREKHIHRAVHPDDRADFRAFYRELARGERTSGSIEYRTNPEFGDVRWVRDNVHRIEGEDRLLGLARDITDRKRHARRREQIVERVTDAIVEVDEDWRFTLVNREAEALYDMAEEDLLGKNFWEVFEDALGTCFEEEYRGTMQSREPTRLEAHYPGLDGWFDIQVYPNDDGGVAFYFEEITERKERERQLREAKEEAERMNRLKSAFLANMSHEIRTPLTSIIGFAEVLGEESSGEEGTVSRLSGHIEQGGKRLLETLDAVLNLSKLEAGEMTLRSEPLDLAAQVEAVTEEFAHQVEKAEVELFVETEGTAWAEADEGGLQIVLRNLLSNAIKYTGEGGTVWVRARAEDEMTVLEVEDTGIGMDPERAEELFEAFKQASEGMDRKYEGSGLGLTITRKVVDHMGGTVHVETEKGEGSRFVVRLPPAERG